MLEWLTAEENLELADVIEEVNEKMLETILERETDVVVFFCK